MLRWVTRHRKSTAAGALVTAVSVALGIIAFTYDGFTTTDVDLNDGGVWVTKQDTQQLGRINVQAEELDAGLISPTASFDVLQDDDAVLLHNLEASSVMIVDPVQVVTGAIVQLPPQGEVALNAGTVVIVDRADGNVWAMPFSDIGGYSADSTEPLLELGEGAAATVGRDGTVHAVSPRDGQLVSIETLDDGTLGEPSVRERGELRAMEDPTITAVGDQPVIHDAGTSTLLVPGGAVEVPADAEVQLVGDASDRVILATPTSLISQPLGGGDAEVREQQGGGDAVRPVQLGGCVFAVWPGSAHFLRDCADDARDLDQQVDGIDGSPIVFRINRDQVVLNQYVQGASWLLSDTLVLVDNWQDLVPPESEEQSEEEDSESTEDLLTNQPPPINEENTPPIASDDDFGARAGRSTLLPVLWNDSDPDGDVLTARVLGDVPQGVQVAPVANDSQLQVELPDDFGQGSFTFDYRVADGRGGEADARVTVRVRGEGENGLPEPMREQAFAVEQGGEYEYQVLAEWIDPDGDDMYLRGAVSESGDTIQTDPSGRLVYTATGEVGLQTVVVTVSDSTGAETTGEILVDVRERGDAPPLANADFVSTVEGRDVTARPLLNDFSPSGRPLRLASVDPNGSLEMTTDLQSGTVRITGGSVGSHYLTYLVADGGLSSQGRIRIDIRTPDDEARPVAVRDVALLPQQGSTLVDLLANDVDPAGGVLVVQQFTIESAAPITVELRDRRVVSIVDNRLEAPFSFTYTVSNGRFSETGTVEVIPVTPPTQPRPPKAVDDQATVRAGDYATVDIIDNDFSPDGAPFELSRIVETSFASEEEGIAFLSQGKLRVHALEGAPTRATVTYELADGFGNRDSATVAITIVPREAEQNTPPAPETVTSRVLAGSTVRIPIPLDGIDPDGDGVELVGYDSAPDGGRILTTVGPDFFDFEAFPDSAGTVEFTYRVRDRWGAEGTATAVIGIAQAADVNQTPFAQTDIVTVRPDRAIAIDVLENDSDPDQDALSLQTDRLELTEGVESATVNVERNTVDLRSPSEPGEYQFTYGVVDARGASTTGTVLLTVADDAPLQAPVALDDPLPRDDLEVDVPLDVPVLENDRDPDGDPSELQVSVVTGPGRVVGDAVQVTPSDAFQVVTYRVADIDGLTAEAFVAVPPVRDRAPFLKSTEPVTVNSGIEQLLPLRDYVTVSTTNAPRITTGDKVTAVNSEGALIVDEQTLRFQSPAGYVGPASITFEVTDGTGPDNGNVATLTIPITVLPSSVVPPTFAGAVVRAEAGEGTASFDLRDATSDPDPGDLEQIVFEERGGSMAGVETSLQGSVFSATAAPNTAPGTTGSFQIVVIDPHGNEAPGTVIVEVVASNRPLAQARPNTGEATAGEPVTVDVVSDDFNPFQNDGLPLRMVSAEVVAGDGASISNTEREVTVTPGTDFSGVLTVRYTVQDATERIERQVSGTLTLNVKARPDAPPRPNVDAVGDSEVTLTWAPPSANGSPITGYTVQSSDGAISFPCSSTTCTVTGLVNNTTYTFQVVATNAVGESDPSPASNQARPDVRPEQPAPPSTTRGDTQAMLAWTPPENRGSPIQHYVIEISPPAPGGVVQQQAAGTSHTWTGLANGTAYTFRIQAVNLADEPSDFSAYSQAVTPAGPPTQVQGVSATPDRSIPGSVRMRVEWQAPNENGAAITGYTVTPSNGARAAQATSTTASFSFEATGENVTFTVTATNDAGTSQPSAPSAPVRVFTAPAAPSGVTASEGDTNSVVSWTPGSTNGLRANEVVYQVQGGGAGTQSFGPGGTYTGMNNNGGPYTMQVRAVAVIDGVNYASDWSSASNQVRPFGAIGSPSAGVAGSEQRQITFSWSSPPANGRALTTEIRIDNGQWRGVAASGRETIQGEPSSQHTIDVRVTSAAFQAGNDPLPGHGAQRTSASASGSIPDLPEPSLSLSRGGNVRAPNGQTGTNYVLNWTNLVAGQQYRYECHSTSSGNFQGGTWTAPSTNGSSPRDTYTFCMSGYDGQGWMVLFANGKSWQTPRTDWP